MKKLLFILLIPLFLTGCYNMNEINDLSIITMLGIDYKDENYIINAGIVNFKDSNEKMVVISSEGKTVGSAINNLEKIYPKKTYLSHLKVLLLSENVLKEKALDSINYLVNYPGTGLNFYIITTNDDVDEFLKSENLSDNVLSTAIISSLENGLEDASSAPPTTADMFLNDLISNGKSPVIPLINIQKSSNPSSKNEKLFVIDGAITINNESVISKLNKDEITGYNFLKNTNSSTNMTTLCKGGKITIDLKDIKADIKYETFNTFMINLSAKSDVSDYSCKMEKSIETEEYIKKLTEDLIKDKLKSTINASITYKTDFIGFGTFIYAYDYKYFKKISDVYEKDYLKDIKYDIKTDLKFSNTGNLRITIEGSD